MSGRGGFGSPAPSEIEYPDKVAAALRGFGGAVAGDLGDIGGGMFNTLKTAMDDPWGHPDAVTDVGLMTMGAGGAMPRVAGAVGANRLTNISSPRLQALIDEHTPGMPRSVGAVTRERANIEAADNVRPTGNLRDLAAVLRQASSVPEADRLGVLHNTRIDRLTGADYLGGFPVPSIAVVKPAHGFDAFGDITLVGHPSLVQPTRDTPVFASDAYTPRFPNIDFKGEGAGSNMEMKGIDHPDARIFRGFTDQGNRRYAPVTMANVLREMKGNIRGGEGGNYGVGTVRAKVTPQFGSLREIADARGRIIPDSDMSKLKDATNDELWNLAEQFKPYSDLGSDSGLRHTSQFENVLQDGGIYGIPKQLKEYRYKDVPPDLIEKAQRFMTKLRDMPTEYFEAKPQRAVKLNEFKGAVVPTGSVKEIAPLLLKHGIKDIQPYGLTRGFNDPHSAASGYNEASRKRALQKFMKYFFGTGGAAAVATQDQQ